MRLTWLAEVLRGAGLRVVELDGWRSRGRNDIEVNGVVCHHTATTRSVSDAAVARLLRDGRSDLPGPLCQLGLRRDGAFVTIAAGRANHNGYGTWGNDSIGIEAYNDGQGEPWPAVQLDAYARGCAALIAHVGLSVAHVRGHKETDPDRKIDPLFDMDAFRADVTAVLHPPSPQPLPVEEDTVVIQRKNTPTHAIAVIDGVWYMSTDGGISSDAAIVVDESAWAGITAGKKIVKV